MSNEDPQFVNNALALDCQKTCSSCCKKGKIFLPDAQYDAICDWLERNSAAELGEFRDRCEHFDGFHLYDQKNKCQFLDAENLCRLHTQGVKPRECFWWPLHVYMTGERKLEIRASTSCCDAFQHLRKDSPYVDEVQAETEFLGSDIIERFRSVYPGSYSGIPLRTFVQNSSPNRPRA